MPAIRLNPDSKFRDYWLFALIVRDGRDGTVSYKYLFQYDFGPSALDLMRQRSGFGLRYVLVNVIHVIIRACRRSKCIKT